MLTLKCQRLGFTLQDYEKTKEIIILYLQVDEQQYTQTRLRNHKGIQARTPNMLLRSCDLLSLLTLRLELWEHTWSPKKRRQ